MAGEVNGWTQRTYTTALWILILPNCLLNKFKFHMNKFPNNKFTNILYKKMKKSWFLTVMSSNPFIWETSNAQKMLFIINKEQAVTYFIEDIWIHCLGSNQYQFHNANKQKDLTLKPKPVTSGIWMKQEWRTNSGRLRQITAKKLNW